MIAPVLTASAIVPGASRNYSFLTDPELEKAVAAATAETDPAAATTLWEKANRIATESGAWIPWSWDETAIVLGPRVRDARYLPFLTQIDWVNAHLGQAESA
jgi:ABC-type transport system substrate-binding protein